MGSTNYKKLCPAYWHVPSDAELATLANFLGGGVAGGKMKTIGTTYWNSPNTGATNERRKHNLPFIKSPREYEMVAELPYGKQAQVDFGEYNLRNTSGNRVKVFFFILTLSRSRFKYVWFIIKYFTSLLAVEAHEKAFAYIRGVPMEMVYDQDKVFMVSENGGDLILTDTFRAYTREQSFSLYFCRKSDPESKGKVENVVRYVKRNFLYNRTLHTIETLNDEVLGWWPYSKHTAPRSNQKRALL